MATGKSAIVFGSTGLIGGYLLKDLLDNPAYVAVTVVVRRDTGVRQAMLGQLFAGHRSVGNIKEKPKGDYIFCGLGTTKKKNPDPDEYYRMDHDCPVAAARYTKDDGASAFSLVSAVWVNPTSVATRGERGVPTYDLADIKERI